MSHKDINELHGRNTLRGVGRAEYEVLGYLAGTDVLGDDPAMDKKALANMGVNVLAEALNRGVSYGLDKKAADDAAAAKAASDRAAEADSDERAMRVIRADAVLVQAVADAAVADKIAAGKPKDQAAQNAARAKRALAEQARDTQQQARDGLPSSAAAKRASAADAASRKASADWDAKPGNFPLEARARAAQQVAQEARAGAAPVGPGAPGALPTVPPSGEPSFFTRVRWGAPTYVWVGGGAVAAGLAATVVGLLIKRRKGA